MTHDPLCPLRPPMNPCDTCALIARVREDERRKSGDCMCPHPNVECQHPTCPRGVPEVRVAALRDAKRAVWEALGPMDCTDPTQMDTALAAIEALGGER